MPSASILRKDKPVLRLNWLSGEVAEILTRVRGRRIRYRPASIPSFVLREVRHGRPASLALMMAGLCTVQRVGRAAPVRPDLERLTGRAPSGLAD